ncbi:hypothetical protein AB0O00_40350, partial [Kitasatospora sp. NPDC093558]
PYARPARPHRMARDCAPTCAAASPDAAPPAAAVAHGTHRNVYRPDGELGFLERWLTAGERERCTPQEQLERFLARSFRIAPGIRADEPLLDRLRHTPGFTHAAAIAGACHEVELERMRRDPAYSSARLSLEPIRKLLTDLWGSTGAEADFHALDRGFDSLDKAAEAARPFYLLVRFGPDLDQLSDFERREPAAG